jgi:hypothetical protein
LGAPSRDFICAIGSRVAKHMEIALILLVVLIGLALGDLALVRALSRRRESSRRDASRREASRPDRSD